MTSNQKQTISWSSGLAALAVMSWLIGSWSQVADRQLLMFQYWQWWANGGFLVLVAVVLKLGELKRRSK